MTTRRLTAALAMAGLLSGCSHDFGPKTTTIVDASTFGADRKKPDTVLSADIKAAVWRELDIGNGPLDGTVNPYQYQAAGYNYVYRKCGKYFDLLTTYQDENHFGATATTAGGLTAAAIMAALKASSVAIAAVASGFTFAGSVFGAYDKNALMTPYPVETKSLILNSLDQYRDQHRPENARSAAEAIVNVQHFAEICTYSGISRAARSVLLNATGTVRDLGSTATIDVLSNELGLAKHLSDKQAVALDWLLAVGLPCDGPKTASCQMALDRIGPLKDKVFDTSTGKYLDVTALKALVEPTFAALDVPGSDFRKAVDAFPDEPTKPVAPTPHTSTNRKHAGKAVEPAKPPVLTPAPPKARTFAADRNGLGESFGQFRFDRPILPYQAVPPNQ